MEEVGVTYIELEVIQALEAGQRTVGKAFIGQAMGPFLLVEIWWRAFPTLFRVYLADATISKPKIQHSYVFTALLM